MPKGSRTSSRARSLSQLPVASIVIASAATSTTLALKSWIVSMTWLRVGGVGADLDEQDLALHRGGRVELDDLEHLDELVELLRHLLEGSASTSTTTVMREISGFSVGPTASELMLKPRRENRAGDAGEDAGLVLDEDRQGVLAHAQSSRSQTGAACRAAWILSLLTPAGTIGHTIASRWTMKSMTTGRSLVSSACLMAASTSSGRLAPQAEAAVGVGELDEVGHRAGCRLQVGVGVALVVEERLPLAHHAERAVVDDRDLDRDVVDDAGRELLVGHLEAAVAVDRPDRALRLGDLGAHGRRHREAHGAEAAGVDPGVGALVLHELRRPHLVLADAGDVGRLGARDGADPLDDVLRREGAVLLACCSRAGRCASSPATCSRHGVVVPGAAASSMARSAHRAMRSLMTSLHVTDDRHVGDAVLADLGRVDVGVDHLGVGGEGRQLAGHAVVEAGPEGDEEVGLLQRRHRRDGAVHAGHAEVERVAVGHRTARHERRDDRDPGQLDEPAQLLAGAGADDAAADVEHRPLRLGDQPGGLADLLAVRPGHRAVAGQVDLRAAS